MGTCRGIPSGKRQDGVKSMLSTSRGNEGRVSTPAAASSTMSRALLACRMAPAHIRARREDGDSSRLQDVAGAGTRRGEKGCTRLQREWDRGAERGP